MYEALFSNFNRFVSLNVEEKEVIETLFRYKKYRRREYILQQGDISRYETFVVSGLTRTYEVDDRGQEHILHFGPENWWVGDMYSFEAEVPSQLYIDCLEETEVLQLSKANRELLYSKIPKLERYFRILIQNAYMTSIKRISSTMVKSGWERYKEFIENYPLIEQRVPYHQIAAYLGITPQSLSRIRRRCMLNKKISMR